MTETVRHEFDWEEVEAMLKELMSRRRCSSDGSRILEPPQAIDIRLERLAVLMESYSAAMAEMDHRIAKLAVEFDELNRAMKSMDRRSEDDLL